MTESRLKAVLLVALMVVFATGLFAQPRISVTTSAGTSTVTNTYSPAPKAPATGKNWIGPASTDYYTIEQSSPLTPPNPQIAVGPDSILAIVNRTIVHYKNPNALGNSAVTDPNVNPPTNQVFLSVWLGTLQNKLCPTFPRDNKTCVIDNASVKYDQMQGRFVVSFTVVDTGVPAGQAAPNPTADSTATDRALAPWVRKASWVVIISKYAQLNLGTNGTTSPFTDPNPTGETSGNPGNITDKNWLAYTGDLNDLPGNAAPDTKGNFNGDQPGPAADKPNYGYPYTPTGAASPVDCRAVPNANTVCFVPTSMRVGLDNNNITVVSGVLNDNVIPSLRGTTAGKVSAYAGARVRIYRKKTLYSFSTTLTRWALNKSASNFVDLADTTAPYAAETVHEVPAAGADPNTLVGGPSAGLAPVFYEPNHLRGRAIASFNSAFVGTPGGCFIYQNQPTSSSANPCDDSTSYLVGAVNTNILSTPQTKLYVRGIQVIPTGALNNPSVAQWTPALVAAENAKQTVNVPGFANPGATIAESVTGAVPGTIPQLIGSKSGTACADGTKDTCTLYVGDSRPQTVIYREGFLYVARTGQTTNAFLADGAPMVSTVIYDVVRKYKTADTKGAADPMEVLYSYWQNGNFWGPMYDTPANVINYGSVSPISIFPWLERLFVSTNYNYAPSLTQLQPSPTTNTKIYPSLFDIKQGVDFYDTLVPVVHPVTGEIINRNAFGYRGGASTDPNNGSLWAFGAYARGREYSIQGPGQWGTWVANYDLTLSSTDPYGNSTALYSDVTPSDIFYPYVQIAKNVGIGPAGSSFGKTDEKITRQEMARWVVLSQMDEAGVNAYLKATGGCYTSFADVAPNCEINNADPASAAAKGQVCHADTKDVPTDLKTSCNWWKYIETMYRRGYTKGCVKTNDPRATYCPEALLERDQMATFIIRAKMNNVFPTVLSGCATGQTCADSGDNFGLFFTDVSKWFGDVPTGDPFANYINKLRELRITDGFDATTYKPKDNLTRGQIAKFMVRAFFY